MTAGEIKTTMRQYMLYRYDSENIENVVRSKVPYSSSSGVVGSKITRLHHSEEVGII